MPKQRVIEVQVRMDCNGCMQKIKKALHGVNGICELYIDFPQQKITVIGWADPESIAKAIKKTRKTAIICSHTEPPDHPEGELPDSAAQGDGPGAQEPRADPDTTQPESANPSQTEGEAVQQAEPLKDPPPPPPPQENPKPDIAPSQVPVESTSARMSQPPLPRDVDEVHVIYHHQPDYGYTYGGYSPGSMNHGYTRQWNSYPTSPGFSPEPQPPQPVYVTHSYNTYRASPYVTGYDYIRPPAPTPAPAPASGQQYAEYNRASSADHTRYSRPPPAPISVPGPQYAEYDRALPPEHTHYRRPPPAPQYTDYSRAPPPEYTHYYSRPAQAVPAPTTQYTDYSRAAPPPEYTHYSRPAQAVPVPTTQYTDYSRAVPPPEYTHYSRAPPTPLYTNYNYSRPASYHEDYHYGNGNGNITSVFSDENPNACRIV